MLLFGKQNSMIAHFGLFLILDFERMWVFHYCHYKTNSNLLNSEKSS